MANINMSMNTVGQDMTSKSVHVDAIADCVHDTWCCWMAYLFGQCVETPSGSLVIPAETVGRWRRQSRTSFADLPEGEKMSDRYVARQWWGKYIDMHEGEDAPTQSMLRQTQHLGQVEKREK